MQRNPEAHRYPRLITFDREVPEQAILSGTSIQANIAEIALVVGNDVVPIFRRSDHFLTPLLPIQDLRKADITH
jgi:hypothetical protein